MSIIKHSKTIADKKIEQYMDAKEAVFTANETDSVECDVEDLLPMYDAYRAFFAHLSKITRQVWRFLESCFRYKPSQRLYEVHLRPLLERHL